MPKQPYLSINLNPGSAQGGPTAAALVERIRTQIGDHHLASGCRLPPVRVLAHQLGISKNTVQRAYDELVAQGLVENKRRVGLFLARPEREIPPAPKAQAAPLALLGLSIGAPFRNMGRPLVIEVALFEFLDRGYYDVHMKQVNEELDQRYKNCLDMLKETMPAGVKWTKPGGGLVLWLEIPRKVSLEPLAAALLARNVRIMISNPAFMGAPHLHGFRICHSAIKPAAMRQGLEILGEELRKQL